MYECLIFKNRQHSNRCKCKRKTAAVQHVRSQDQSHFSLYLSFSHYFRFFFLHSTCLDWIAQSTADCIWAVKPLRIILLQFFNLTVWYKFVISMNSRTYFDEEINRNKSKNENHIISRCILICFEEIAYRRTQSYFEVVDT